MSLAPYVQIGDRKGEARATGNLGGVLFSQGRLSETREHVERSLVLYREIGDRHGEANAQLNLAALQREQGEGEKSEAHLVACLALCEEPGHREVGCATRLALGSLRAARSREEGGGGEEGRESLAAARDLASQVGIPDDEVLARCGLALLPGGDAADALAAYTEHEERLRPRDRQRARLLLFKATGDRAHLAEAKRLLDEALAKVPPEFHESMRRNLRVHREILAAWQGESAAGSSGGEPHGTESITRAGPS